MKRSATHGKETRQRGAALAQRLLALRLLRLGLWRAVDLGAEVGTEKSGLTYREQALDRGRHLIEADAPLQTAIARLPEAGSLLVVDLPGGGSIAPHAENLDEPTDALLLIAGTRDYARKDAVSAPLGPRSAPQNLQV